MKLDFGDLLGNKCVRFPQILGSKPKSSMDGMCRFSGKEFTPVYEGLIKEIITLIIKNKQQQNRHMNLSLYKSVQQLHTNKEENPQ